MQMLRCNFATNQRFFLFYFDAISRIPQNVCCVIGCISRCWELFTACFADFEREFTPFNSLYFFDICRIGLVAVLLYRPNPSFMIG